MTTRVRLFDFIEYDGQAWQVVAQAAPIWPFGTSEPTASARSQCSTSFRTIQGRWVERGADKRLTPGAVPSDSCDHLNHGADALVGE